MEPMMNGRKVSKKKNSFWKTIPGVITQIGAVVTAIGALVTGVYQSGTLVQKWVSTRGSEKAEVRTSYFKVFPCSLKNCVPFQDFLYWFHVDVHNKSSERLFLQISFTVREGPAGRHIEPVKYTVSPGETLSEKVNPAFELLNYDKADVLDVTWEITAEPGNERLDQGPASIKLWPRNVVDWSLTKPDGQPVPRDYLLASLTAWTLNPAQSVKEYAARLRSSVTRQSNMEQYGLQWFAQCYNKLLREPGGIRIYASLKAFPPQGTQTIRVPQEVLADKVADPLEAAVLIGALCRAVSASLEARLVLFAIPQSEQSTDPKDFLLSWITGSSSWHAIDLSHASQLTYEENEKKSASQVSALLQKDPDIVKELDRSGTFIKPGNGLVALDLGKAAEHFQIRGLP
jgi:hypothetical protein